MPSQKTAVSRTKIQLHQSPNLREPTLPESCIAMPLQRQDVHERANYINGLTKMAYPGAAGWPPSRRCSTRLTGMRGCAAGVDGHRRCPAGRVELAGDVLEMRLH